MESKTLKAKDIDCCALLRKAGQLKFILGGISARRSQR
jgi:hypothetical protein